LSVAAAITRAQTESIYQNQSQRERYQRERIIALRGISPYRYQLEVSTLNLEGVNNESNRR